MKESLGIFANLLIVFGLLLLGLIYLPVLVKEGSYYIEQKTLPEPEVVDNSKKAQTLSQDFTNNKKYLIPVDFDFSLVIPKIRVNSKVIPFVDSSNKEKYLEALQEGVAHARFSSLPNQRGVVYIFAHSTDSPLNIVKYNAQFFLLRKLEAGDEVFIFYKNKKYTYQVTDKQIVEPEEVSSVVANLKGDYLVLQTCSPPGTTLKRLLIIAKLS